MVTFVLSGDVKQDKKDILDMLDKYLFVNISFKKEELANYTVVGNLVELLESIRDKVGVDQFFKRVAFCDVPEEAKVSIQIALDEVL